MVITDSITLRVLEKKKWFTPEEAWEQARLEKHFHPPTMQAALFTCGLRHHTPDFNWEFVPKEIEEINREGDFYLRVRDAKAPNAVLKQDGLRAYKSVQLKQVVCRVSIKVGKSVRTKLEWIGFD